MTLDYVINRGGEFSGHGAVGERFAGEAGFDPGMWRPYWDERPNSRPVVALQTGRQVWNRAEKKYLPETREVRVKDLIENGDLDPTYNATTLRKGDWSNMDNRLQMVVRQRLRAWTDLSAAASFGGFDGWSKLTHEYEAMNDPGEAQVDMEGITDGRTDNPLFKLRSIPLPITHSDFFFTKRRIDVSRRSGTPISTTMAEAAGRRVAEVIERTTIGTETGITFGTQTAGYGAHDGTSTVYGYTNFPARTTKTDLTAPTGTNPEAVMTDVLEMIDLLQADGFYGPYTLYHSTGYSRYLNDDYFRSGSTSTATILRRRILDIEGITDVRRLDYLTSGHQLILVQMTSEYMEAINGMSLQTVQWESQGGMRRNFKVMAIMVPLLKSDYNGNAPIVHGTTS